MEIIIGAFPSYENVRNNAYWTRVGIDSGLSVDNYNIEDYKAHLQDCEKHPTVGLLARKRYITGEPMNYPITADRNLRYIRKQPEVDSLEKSVKERINKLYPETKHVRKYIIDNYRVVLDCTKKVKKYTLSNRLAIFFKRFI